MQLLTKAEWADLKMDPRFRMYLEWQEEELAHYQDKMFRAAFLNEADPIKGMVKGAKIKGAIDGMIRMMKPETQE